MFTSVGYAPARWTVSALIMFGPVTATAGTVLTGTFVGSSVDTQIFHLPSGNFDGTIAAGSFRLDLSGCTDQSFSNPMIGPNCGGSSGPFFKPTTYLIVNTAEGQAEFREPGYIATVANTLTSQILTINFTFMDPYSYTNLTLVGGPNAFISGTDFSHIHAGAIDLAMSSLSYQLGREYRGSVALSSLTLAPVPEPGAWMLLATMTGAVAVGRRSAAR